MILQPPSTVLDFKRIEKSILELMANPYNDEAMFSSLVKRLTECQTTIKKMEAERYQKSKTMKQRLEIKVFKIKENISLPIAGATNNTANCGIGDHIVCYDGKNVYCKDWRKNEDESFVLLLNDLVFIEANEYFFEPIL